MSLARLPALCAAIRASLFTRSQLKLEEAACLHSSAVTLFSDKPRDRRDLTRGVPKASEGVDGQDAMDIDVAKENTKCYRLPDENLANELFDGTPFFETHIVYIKVSKNNTLMSLTDPTAKQILISRSCGTEGFKHCRKGTTVAAQTTGVAMAARMNKAGIKTARVCIKGLGPGRMEALKGLLIGGINVISITDITTYYDHPCRPPAARSI